MENVPVWSYFSLNQLGASTWHQFKWAVSPRSQQGCSTLSSTMKWRDSVLAICWHSRLSSPNHVCAAERTSCPLAWRHPDCLFVWFCLCTYLAESLWSQRDERAMTCILLAFRKYYFNDGLSGLLFPRCTQELSSWSLWFFRDSWLLPSLSFVKMNFSRRCHDLNMKMNNIQLQGFTETTSDFMNTQTLRSSFAVFRYFAYGNGCRGGNKVSRCCRRWAATWCRFSCQAHKELWF